MIYKTEKGGLRSWAGNPRDESRSMKLKIVCSDKSLLPTRAHEHDAGLDLRCAHKFGDRKSTRLNSSHSHASRMPSSA